MLVLEGDISSRKKTLAAYNSLATILTLPPFCCPLKECNMFKNQYLIEVDYGVR
jgi:hypothetical protein